MCDQESEQPYFDVGETSVQDTFNAASVRYRIAIGPTSGKKTLTLRSDALIRSDTQRKPFTVNRDGFSLNAAVACQPHQRDRLERLCRYVTRSPLALERLSTRSTGEVVYALKRPFRDGTTHFVFEPLEFLAKLAALIPRPWGRLYPKHFVGQALAAITQPDVIQKILGHRDCPASEASAQQRAPPPKPPGRVSRPTTAEIQFDAL